MKHWRAGCFALALLTLPALMLLGLLFLPGDRLVLP